MSDLDLGQKSGGYDDKTEDYETYYASEVEIGTKISGEVFITERKVHPKHGDNFTILLTNHDEEVKYVLTFYPTFYDEGTVLYGRKGSKIYMILDPIFSIIYNQEADEKKYRSVDFETFRNTINNNVKTMTIDVLEPTHPLAKNPLLKVTDLELLVEE